MTPANSFVLRAAHSSSVFFSFWNSELKPFTPWSEGTLLMWEDRLSCERKRNGEQTWERTREFSSVKATLRLLIKRSLNSRWAVLLCWSWDWGLRKRFFPHGWGPGHEDAPLSAARPKNQLLINFNRFTCKRRKSPPPRRFGPADTWGLLQGDSPCPRAFSFALLWAVTPSLSPTGRASVLCLATLHESDNKKKPSFFLKKKCEWKT